MSTGSQAECPLCMDPLELDDISFFPCTCGYQICRFCWHRIRTDENGLCPACRRSYTEDPAEFKPLAETDLQKLKKEKRQKESQKKQKAAENRKHLSNVRVVQKNLVFVVGLTQRLADAETLKKHEYFGKFGKIHKIVINQSTSYAGVQGPSASAYVTYYRSEDAIRAIQVVNNVTVDGRTIKASLGTTKYCSYFLRGLSCTKPDCMYLHETGDELASFTKEQMQQGKHLEYEQLLYDEFNENNTKGNNSTTASVPPPPTTCTGPLSVVHAGPVVKNQNTKSSLSGQKKTASSVRHQISRHSGATKSTEGGRPFSTINGLQSRLAHRANSSTATDKLGFDSIQPPTIGNNSSSAKQRTSHQQNCCPLDGKNNANPLPADRSSAPSVSLAATDGGVTLSQDGTTAVARLSQSQATKSCSSVCDELDGKSHLRHGNSASYQSGKGNDQPLEGQLSSHSLIDPVPQNSFGNLSHRTDSHDDDLGFDPWNESTKGLADMMEKENEFSDRVIRPDPFMQVNYLNNCRIAPLDGFYSSCQGMMAGNKALGLKQLPISNRNDTGGCQLSFVPPHNSSTHSTDYQEWHNGLRHVLTKSNANCEAVPQTGSRLITTNHAPQQPQQLYLSYSDLEKDLNRRHSRPGDFLWHPSPAEPGTADVANRQWIASLQQFSDGFPGIQNGFRPEYGPFGRMSNLRPSSQLPPPGLYSHASIPPHMESQSTLADALD